MTTGRSGSTTLINLVLTYPFNGFSPFEWFANAFMYVKKSV